MRTHIDNVTTTLAAQSLLASRSMETTELRDGGRCTASLASRDLALRMRDKQCAVADPVGMGDSSPMHQPILHDIENVIRHSEFDYRNPIQEACFICLALR